MTDKQPEPTPWDSLGPMAPIVQPLTDLGVHGTCALIQDRDGNLIGLHTNKA